MYISHSNPSWTVLPWSLLWISLFHTHGDPLTDMPTLSYKPHLGLTKTWKIIFKFVLAPWGWGIERERISKPTLSLPLHLNILYFLFFSTVTHRLSQGTSQSSTYIEVSEVSIHIPPEFWSWEIGCKHVNSNFPLQMFWAPPAIPERGSSSYLPGWKYLTSLRILPYTTCKWYGLNNNGGGGLLSSPKSDSCKPKSL